MAVIFHIDLNAFFASAEILFNPDLLGKPVAVSGMTRRSVVTTATYEARAMGVHSAMPINEALRLCPGLIVVHGSYERYQQLSKQFMDIIRKYSNLVEPASIDECYADMSETIKKYKRPLDLAWQIQQELKLDLGLQCSIGVAPNRFLAKMASDLHKPMGITVIRKQEVKTKLWPLSIKEMQGIGKKTAPELINLGIHTIGDLANYADEERLRLILGKNTLIYKQRANGIDYTLLENNTETKSMSQSTTLNYDFTEYAEIKETLSVLAKKLAGRLQKENYTGTLISISIRYFNFETIVRSKKLDYHLNLAQDIFEETLNLYDENSVDDIPIRHLGISLSNLILLNEATEQLSLFEAPPELDPTSVFIQKINQQLKKGKVVKAVNVKVKK